MRGSDLIAGVSVAGLILPEGVAYAEIAGLPPHRAIFAAIVGCLIYAGVGRSRYAIVSPTSSSAAILAATLAAVGGDPTVTAGFATIAVALVGVLFVIAAACRLGSLTGFISRPVLQGFAFGLAITIVLRQLPTLAGVSVHSEDLFHLVVALTQSIPAWNIASFGTGALALVGLLGLRRVPVVPGALLVLGLGIAASLLLGLSAHGVATVGTIDTTLVWPTLPSLSWPALSPLVRFTVPLVLILFAESWGTIRALALRHDDAVDANRELGALGAANLASAIVQGMPVGAGFSAGSASEAAGATSRLTSVAAAVALALLILCARPLIAALPVPVLAAVVIAALTHALDPTPLIRLWRIGRDQYVATGAALGVLALGVLNGMLVAIGLSLAALIQRLASARVAQLGRLAGGHVFVDLARHPDAAKTPGILIFRPAQPLFFANADVMLAEIVARTKASGCRSIVLSLEESFDLDSTALDALNESDRALSDAGIRLQLARLHDHARDLLAASGNFDLLARSSYSVDDAVAALAVPS